MKKAVSFKNNERDLAILEYVNTKMNFSAYVKELILKDMEPKSDIKEINVEQQIIQHETSNDESLEFEW